VSLVTTTTQEVADNIIAQLEVSLNQSIPLLPKSFMRVFAKAFAGVYILLYKYAGFSSLQQFVQTATIDETEVNGQLVSPLKQWGNLVGVGDPTAATNAVLTVDINVTNQVGTLLAGAQMVGQSNNVTYLTLTAVTLDAAVKSVQIQAVSDQSGGGGAGTVGNLENGQIVNFAGTQANIQQSATVTGQVVTGAEAEATEVYRKRVLERFQKPPQGGAPSDYEIWGEEVEGIVNIYPYKSKTCPGQIDVYVEATEASSGSADGFPTGAQLQAVLDSIELDQSGLASRRPMGALANTFSISRTAFNVEVLGLVVDNEAQVKLDIEEAISDYLLEAEPFIPGLSVPPKLDVVQEAAIGGAIVDVVNAAGGLFEDAFLFVASAPAVNVPLYILGEGERAKLNTVSYT
jgi:uncharacterized phage protein gp47/JayE